MAVGIAVGVADTYMLIYYLSIYLSNYIFISMYKYVLYVFISPIFMHSFCLFSHAEVSIRHMALTIPSATAPRYCIHSKYEILCCKNMSTPY
jgi:hypothetical protein